jgi:hypothetical protein
MGSNLGGVGRETGKARQKAGGPQVVKEEVMGLGADQQGRHTNKARLATEFELCGPFPSGKTNE